MVFSSVSRGAHVNMRRSHLRSNCCATVAASCAGHLVTIHAGLARPLPSMQWSDMWKNVEYWLKLYLCPSLLSNHDARILFLLRKTVCRFHRIIRSNAISCRVLQLLLHWCEQFAFWRIVLWPWSARKEIKNRIRIWMKCRKAIDCWKDKVSAFRLCNAIIAYARWAINVSSTVGASREATRATGACRKASGES